MAENNVDRQSITSIQNTLRGRIEGNRCMEQAAHHAPHGAPFPASDAYFWHHSGDQLRRVPCVYSCTGSERRGTDGRPARHVDFCVPALVPRGHRVRRPRAARAGRHAYLAPISAQPRHGGDGVGARGQKHEVLNSTAKMRFGHLHFLMAITYMCIQGLYLMLMDFFFKYQTLDLCFYAFVLDLEHVPDSAFYYCPHTLFMLDAVKPSTVSSSPTVMHNILGYNKFFCITVSESRCFENTHVLLGF